MSRYEIQIEGAVGFDRVGIPIVGWVHAWSLPEVDDTLETARIIRDTFDHARIVEMLPDVDTARVVE
jgi:hypothetical protein